MKNCYSLLELLNVVAYNIKDKKVIERAIRKKYLKSFLNKKGERRVMKQDADDYFLGPPALEWDSLKNISFNFNVPIKKLREIKDDHNIKIWVWRTTDYVRLSEIRPILVEKGYLDGANIMPPKKYPIVTKNRPIVFFLPYSEEINFQPTDEICNFCKKYYPDVHFAICCPKGEWEFEGKGSGVFLITLGICFGTQIILKIWGDGLKCREASVLFAKLLIKAKPFS